MDKLSISLKKLRALPLDVGGASPFRVDNPILAATFAANMMSKGFAPTEKLLATLCELDSNKLASLHETTMMHLSREKGAHVKHRPMYPNFPAQVMDAAEVELFFNAIIHYATGGEWLPEFLEEDRPYFSEKVNYQTIDLATEEDFLRIFTKLLSSNDSISEDDKKIVEWFYHSGLPLIYPENFPFKENLCLAASYAYRKGQDISPCVKTATDLLRVVTYLSDGDISLAENTKFKSFKRKDRKIFAKILESVATLEDLNRHRGKWVRLFHSLHIGDFSKKLYGMAKTLRENEKVETFNTKVEAAIKSNDFSATAKILAKRPGEFARRLDHLLREAPVAMAEEIADNFIKVSDQLPTRLICQLLGHFNVRNSIESRVVFPKGSTQKARLLPMPSSTIAESTVTKLTDSLKSVLSERFSKLEDLGKVYLDPALAGCPLPTAQRSASPNSRVVARGTRLPFGDKTKNTLRFFVYWVGEDIDLSATFHDENFNLREHVSYTNLRSKKYQACHSGDITYAPNGASEFIDITIEQAASLGMRYVVMNTYVYSGPTFKDHSTCFGGWMTRSKPKSNEIYDAKTVECKVDLTSKSRACIPAVFDLYTREAIWCDLTFNQNAWQANNVENNAARTQDVLKSIVNLHNKFTLYDLFKLHAESRGELVSSKEEADIVFSLSDGITPYDIMEINSEYLK